MSDYLHGARTLVVPKGSLEYPRHHCTRELRVAMVRLDRRSGCEERSTPTGQGDDPAGDGILVPVTDNKEETLYYPRRVSYDTHTRVVRLRRVTEDSPPKRDARPESMEPSSQDTGSEFPLLEGKRVQVQGWEEPLCRGRGRRYRVGGLLRHSGRSDGEVSVSPR